VKIIVPSTDISRTLKSDPAPHIKIASDATVYSQYFYGELTGSSIDAADAARLD